MKTLWERLDTIVQMKEVEVHCGQSEVIYFENINRKNAEDKIANFKLKIMEVINEIRMTTEIAVDDMTGS